MPLELDCTSPLHWQKSKLKMSISEHCAGAVLEVHDMLLVWIKLLHIAQLGACFACQWSDSLMLAKQQC